MDNHGTSRASYLAAREVSRKNFLRIGGAGLAGVALLGVAGCGGASGGSGEDYPSQPVEYVIPFDPGGESDTTARLQQGPLEEALGGTSVTVSNQPGGGGSLGWSELVNSTEPDGYTIMGHNLPHIILQPLTREDAGYETDALKQVYIFESTPNALIVSGDSPYNTVEDFIAAAQEEPGSISVGGSGEFTSNHVATLQLAQQNDVELQYVPFTGTGSATSGLQSGQVGVAVPPETPDNIVNTRADAFREINNAPEVIQQMEDLGFTIENMGPQEAEQFTQERLDENRQLLQELGLIE